VNSEKRADFVIVPAKGVEIIFELKCFIRGKTANNWTQHLQDDFAKLKEKMEGGRSGSIKFGIGICPDDTINLKGEYHTYPGGQNRITGQDEYHVNRSCVIHYRTFGF